MAQSPNTRRERQITVNVSPQIALNPALSVQPMEVKMTIEQPRTVKTGTVERDAKGQLKKIVIEENNGA